MIIKFHPSAACSLNNKANALVNLIEEFPKLKEVENNFPSDIHIATSITKNDIIGEIDLATSDYRGNTIQRFFYSNERKYGLSEKNYSALHELAEQIHSIYAVRTMLSLLFVEKKLFSWITEKHKKATIHDLFTEYLSSEATSVVQKLSIWIPIANLEVQSAFTVSNSEIRPLSKSIIDKWCAKFENNTRDKNELALNRIEAIRKEYQGLAAVVTTITAEPEYATNYALEESQKITAALGIFSSAALIPDIKCTSCIKGSELIAKSTTFIECDDDKLQMISKIIDKSSMKFWRLRTQDIIEIRTIGLDTISAILKSDSPTNFEKSILNAIFIYSKAAFTADPIEKIVYILSSLESILLKNENEPIQQNLAERIAIINAQELEKRKFVIKTFKAVYSVRSKYLHHGHSSSELQLVSDFLMQAFIFYTQLLANAFRFRTREDFINAIDDRKLS